VTGLVGSRRAVRHVLIGLATLATAGAVYLAAPSPNAARRLALATAYPGLALLALTLVIGPWYVWRGRRPPVSVTLRRDIGIWGGVVAAVHTVLGFRVHFRGDWRRYFLVFGEDGGIRLRLDMMGWTNHVGLVALLILITLMAISNDLALRRLGAARWKAVQRWNYAAFALVALHAVMFQVMVRRTPVAIAAVVVGVAATAAIQLAGIRARRAGLRPGSGSGGQ
jgi:DMSO/TMAO reductase YedYZ heme-binding membrane subunit